MNKPILVLFGMVALGGLTGCPPNIKPPSAPVTIADTATNTPVITNTPTVTSTPAITQTPTETSTSIFSSTPTNTATFTSTSTLTSTPTVTDTFIPTFTPTATSTPIVVDVQLQASVGVSVPITYVTASLVINDNISCVDCTHTSAGVTQTTLNFPGNWGGDLSKLNMYGQIIQLPVDSYPINPKQGDTYTFSFSDNNYTGDFIVNIIENSTVINTGTETVGSVYLSGSF